MVEDERAYRKSRDMPGFQNLFGRRACRFLSAVLIAAIVGSRLLFLFLQHVRQLADAFKAGDGGGGLRQETGIRVDSLNSLVGSHSTCNFFNQLSDTHFKLLIVFVCRKVAAIECCERLAADAQKVSANDLSSLARDMVSPAPAI